MTNEQVYKGSPSDTIEYCQVGLLYKSASSENLSFGS